MSNSSYPETLSPTETTFPYYIVVPPYTKTSSGVIALHVLCHWLNMKGFSAFLYFIPRAVGLGINPRLQTPILDANIVAYHFKMGQTPVIVYPEVIPGNPLDAPVCARWVGNYPGLLGGMTEFDPNELCFAHSKHLARSTGSRANVLCIPVVDTNVFKPSSEITRKGICFYAHKFQNVHGQSVFGLPAEAIEITRSNPATPAELAQLFKQSELFYCFEDSAIINEAALCGCPVVMMKNPYFGWPLGIEEVGWDGYAWGDDPSEIDRAKESVARAYDNYIKNIPRFFTQLHVFILLTQRRALITPYIRQVSLPGEDEIIDEESRLRQNLADVILELSTYKAGLGDGETLWVPELAMRRALSALTFVSGWGAIDPHGARGSDACALTVCPGQSDYVELTFALDSASITQKAYNLVYDFDVCRQLMLKSNRALPVLLPVLDRGRPVFVSITAVDLGEPGTILLKFAKGMERNALKTPDPEAENYREPTDTAAVSFFVEKNTADRLQAFNCALTFTDSGLDVETLAPDPHILVAMDSAGDGLAPMFLWGAYEADRDEILQVYMPAGPHGFAESLSCTVALKKGHHVFVTRLPKAKAIGPIRVDPMSITGRLHFSVLAFVFSRAHEARAVVKTKIPMTPRLDRFMRLTLLDGTAFPLTHRCVVTYVRNALEVQTREKEASIIFYFSSPIWITEERPISIHIVYESTLPGMFSIRFPDADGTYSENGRKKDAQIMKGYQSMELQASLSGPLQSLQLVLYSADVVRLVTLDVLVARD